MYRVWLEELVKHKQITLSQSWKDELIELLNEHSVNYEVNEVANKVYHIKLK
jgi:hypothetical protein